VPAALVTRNSTNQVCYPDLNSHPPNYAAACGPIPVHSCGDTFYVANYCDCTDPIGALLTVVDHGPRVACMVDIPQCDLCTCTGTGYYRYMDLPQGTFVELDGDLDEGLIIVVWSNWAGPLPRTFEGILMHLGTSRRALLRSSAVVAGTLGLVRGPSRLWGQPRSPYEVATCDVKAVSNEQIYCADDQGNPMTLPVDPGTRIWRGKRNAGLGTIKQGDHIVAQIEVTPTGQRRVRKMWVNIANVTGTVLKLTPDGFDLVISHGVGSPGQILPILVGDNVNIDNGHPTKAAIAPGLRAQVIGQGLPGGKAGVTRVLATTIFLYNKQGVMLGAGHLPIKRGSAVSVGGLPWEQH